MITMFTFAPLTFFLCISNIFAQKYTDKYNAEVDAVLKSERLLKNYLDCLLDKGVCTPAGEELKKDIPDALKNECAKCNVEHIEGVRKVFQHLAKTKPEYLPQLQKKFDPTGEYKQKYQHYLNEDGIKF